jgi:hypothetical protein
MKENSLSLMKIFTSFTPILMTLSSKSDNGTFNCLRYDIVDIDDIGVTYKSSFTMYIDGPLTNDFAIEDLGPTNLNGTNFSLKLILL